MNTYWYVTRHKTYHSMFKTDSWFEVSEGEDAAYSVKTIALFADEQDAMGFICRKEEKEKEAAV